jgi:pyruvate dehydrogenase E1 component alpha subunit
MGPHTTSDDPTRYRTQDELDRWSALDPIARYRTYLESIGVWSQRTETIIEGRAARLRTELRDAVFGAPDVDAAEIFEHVYAEMTPDLIAQREQLFAELRREAQ